MARQRITETQLNSYDDVDGALRTIGELQRELAMIEADQNEHIDEIKAAAKEQAQPLHDVIKAHEAAIEQFCTAHRADFVKEKTRALTFGSVGFRLSTKIAIKSIEKTLQAIKDYELWQCLRIKEEPDKEAMRDLDDETLAAVGAARKIENIFGYEVNAEKLANAA